ncbi:universal stress protein [Maridesulfovibrio bastinii]|uniref:universal stress protein n=1 Tax=Maridesulfovibrio bastinii TaxID=47157 RepID=UPI000429AE97|nr:universal stress protein [Maridesulfovibrio bastinii]
MKKVSIVVDESESSFWLAYYAMGLSSRIPVEVSILMVRDDEYSTPEKDQGQWIGSPEKKLESILAEEHFGSTHIDYYVLKGRMEDEIPKFIRENNISKLFIGRPQGNNPELYTKLMRTLDAVASKTHCEVEVVQKVSAYGKRK